MKRKSSTKLLSPSAADEAAAYVSASALRVASERTAWLLFFLFGLQLGGSFRLRGRFLFRLFSGLLFLCSLSFLFCFPFLLLLVTR